MVEYPNLEKEASDFNRIYKERFANIQSLIIDDDRVEDYYYKNPWRYGFSRRYAFGTTLEQFRRVRDQFSDDPIDILEIGCGNGWFSINSSIEYKDHWTCFDISSEAITTAKYFAARSGLSANQYLVNSVQKFESEKQYDIICCTNTLHHFTDLDEVYSKVKSLLKPHGHLFIYDVCSDLFTQHNASLVMLARLILETGGKDLYYFEELEGSGAEALDGITTEWIDETESTKQSEHDHYNSTETIIASLKKEFTEVHLQFHGGILMRLLGGFRGNTEKMESLFGKLVTFEKELLKRDIIAPYSYSFIGRK